MQRGGRVREGGGGEGRVGHLLDWIGLVQGEEEALPYLFTC